MKVIFRNTKKHVLKNLDRENLKNLEHLLSKWYLFSNDFTVFFAHFFVHASIFLFLFIVIYLFSMARELWVVVVVFYYTSIAPRKKMKRKNRFFLNF